VHKHDYCRYLRAGCIGIREHLRHLLSQMPRNFYFALGTVMSPVTCLLIPTESVQPAQGQCAAYSLRQEKSGTDTAGPAQVRQFVSGYSSAPPSTVGSVLVQDLSSKGQYSAVDTATVHFRPIPDSVIEQLIEEGTVFSCAGAAPLPFPILSSTCPQQSSRLDGIQYSTKDTSL